MPLDKFVLILVAVIAAAGVSIWLVGLIFASVSVPGAWLILVPLALVIYVAWRVIAERLTNKEDDHYDHIQK